MKFHPCLNRPLGFCMPSKKRRFHYELITPADPNYDPLHPNECWLTCQKDPKTCTFYLTFQERGIVQNRIAATLAALG